MANKKLISIRANKSDLILIDKMGKSKTIIWQEAVDKIKLKATKEKKLKSTGVLE